MFSCLLVFPASHEQKRQSVVSTGESVVDLECAAVVADGIVGTVGFGEGNCHVLQDAQIVWMVPECQPVRSERSVEVTLALQRKCLV